MNIPSHLVEDLEARHIHQWPLHVMQEPDRGEKVDFAVAEVKHAVAEKHGEEEWLEHVVEGVVVAS
jgi:hypothetical protein